MQHAVRYVEEGLASLTQAGGGLGAQAAPGSPGRSSDSGPAAGLPGVPPAEESAPGAQSELERELLEVLSAMRAVQQSWRTVKVRGGRGGGALLPLSPGQGSFLLGRATRSPP